MGRGKSKSKRDFLLFDVVYQDGTRSSNRKVPADALAGQDGDDAAREVFETQDREIAQRSGEPRGRIDKFERVPDK